MSSENLVAILTEIRDQQKQQIVNFEHALKAQEAAAATQKDGQRFYLALLIVPWIVVLCLIGVIVVPRFI